jgi:hypothetical protein
MPLGNHTSQFFANLYLNELDQFVKHILKAKYYIRYVDDFVILHENKEQLEKWKKEIDDFLKNKLKLELHPDKSGVINLKEGVTFLGFRIFYNFMLIRKSNLGRFENKFKELKILYAEDEVDRNKVVEHLEGWMSYASYANTYKYRKELLKSFNKNFPIRNGQLLSSSKKTANFLKKLDGSKLEFSTQQTLWLFLKRRLKPNEIALERGIKEATVWAHFAKLIEYGQLRIWSILPKWKIVKILIKIKSGKDFLRDIKERLNDKTITFDEINCVLAHVKFKEKIKNI